MTHMDSAVSTGMDSGIESPLSTTSVESTTTEKMLPQSQVSRLIGQAKRETAERYEREYVERTPAYPPSSSNKPLTREDAQALFSEEAKKLMDIEQRKKEEENQKQYKAESERFASDFINRVHSSKSRYEDFDSVFQDFNFSIYTPLVALTMEYGDKTGDMWVELARNPQKLANLAFLAERGDLTRARIGLSKLSSSIEENSKSSDHSTNSEPLRRMQQTNMNAGRSSGDENKMAPSQLRKLPYMKG